MYMAKMGGLDTYDGNIATTTSAGTPQRMGKCREISPETVHGASSLMASFHNLGNLHLLFILPLSLYDNI